MTAMEAGRKQPRSSSRYSQWRRPGQPDRFVAITLTLPALKRRMPATPKRKASIAAGVMLIALGAPSLIWLKANQTQPAPESEIFLFEEDLTQPEPPPPRPDPAPPPPKPPEPEPEPPPPPQFGLQEEDVAEPTPEPEQPDADDMEVALGNTLMTEADSVVKPPPPPLPRAPERLDQPLRIARGRAPEYPPRALERGLQGMVVVLITVDTLGYVKNAVVEQSGGALFDRSALRNARRLIFQPHVRDGRPREVSFTRRYEFTLE